MSCWRLLPHCVAVLAVAVAALLASSAVAAQAASTTGLPADTAAKGYIGLCNEAGKNVTGGSVATRPFIWKAISSSRPPASYQGQGQNAVLGIYQPRPQTLPAYWSGISLTAASFYRSKQVPTVQATYADLSLGQMIKQFPPQVNGLYVLRFYYGKANYGLYRATYPVAVIQVTGRTWHLVQGGTVDCAKGVAESNEQLTGVVSKKQVVAHAPSRSQHTVDSDQSRVITGDTTASGTATRSADPAGLQSAAGGNASSAGSTSSQVPGNEAAARVSTPGTSWVLWVLVGVVAVLAAALAVVLRQRRVPLPGHPAQPPLSEHVGKPTTDKDRSRP